MRKRIFILLGIIFLCNNIFAKDDKCCQEVLTLQDTIAKLRKFRDVAAEKDKQARIWRYRYDSIQSGHYFRQAQDLKRKNEELEDTLQAFQVRESYYKTTLVQYKEEIKGYEYFKKKWLAQTIKEQEEELQRSFKELSNEQLDKMEALCMEVKNEKGIDKLLKKIAQTRRNLKIYNNAKKVVETLYHAESVARESKNLSQIVANTLSPVQKQDIQETTLALQSYKKGIKDFQKIINYINWEAKVYRESGKELQTKKRISELYENTKSYETDIYKVPYLKEKYEQYKKDLNDNPLVNSSVEKEIISVQL